MILKALKWAYGDSLRYIAFMVSAYLVVGFAFIFIVYPWQTIATLVGGFVLWTLFLLFSEWR